MTIRHVDRTGHPWTFDIDCTPVQGRMFERLLLSARNVGNREELTLSYLAAVEENTAFRNVLEHVVLSALRTWAETLTNRHPAPPVPPVSPVEVRKSANVKPSTVSKTANVTPFDVNELLDVEDDGERKPYYWEDF